MADYYTELSFTFEMPSEALAAKAVALIADIEEYVANPEGKQGLDHFKNWVDEWITTGVNVEAEKNLVWVADDCGCPELEFLVSCLQEVLKRYHPDGCIGFDYAHTCSKHRENAFGGGAVFLTKDKEDWWSSYQWLDAKRQEYQQCAALDKAS